MKVVPYAVASIALGLGLTGVGVNAAFGKDVTLDVDGEQTVVSVLHESVAEVLVDAGVTLGVHDAVSPELTAVVGDGTTITVTHGRPVTLTLDGVAGTYWTTATTVADLIADLGLDPAAVKTSSPASAAIPLTGTALDVTTGKNVTLTADGTTRDVQTFGQTVADALADAQVAIDGDDIVTPPPATEVTDGQAVTVVRVDHQTVTRDEAIPYDETTTESADLVKGTSKVTTPGVDGVKTVTVDVTLHDGQPFTETVTGEAVTKEPVTQVTTVGTKEPVKTPSGGVAPSSSTGPVTWGDFTYPSAAWAAIAKCESGGNPRAVNPAGYYGLYQFSLPTWHAMGGTGNPIDASPEEQTMRAVALQQRAGWGQWGCAYIVGII